MFGRRTLNGSSGYKQYGSSRSGQHLKSDIELEKGPRGASGRRGTTSHVISSKHANTSLGRTEIDSQESILRVEDMKPGQQMPRSHKDASNRNIVRTDVVTVTYDAESVEGRKEDWRRI